MRFCQTETRDMAPEVLPFGWRYRRDMVNGACNLEKKLSVIWTVEEHQGKRWAHVSMAGETNMPTYTDLVWVKNWILGRDAKAIQIFAPASEHVNDHPCCLHLWSCLDDDGLPDFRRAGTL